MGENSHRRVQSQREQRGGGLWFLMSWMGSYTHGRLSEYIYIYIHICIYIV